MSLDRSDPLFAMAINHCDQASQGRDMVVNLAKGLRYFIEGIRKRQPPPTNLQTNAAIMAKAQYRFLDMAISHCMQAATTENLADQWRLAQLATALQQFIAGMQ